MMNELACELKGRCILTDYSLPNNESWLVQEEAAGKERVYETVL